MARRGDVVVDILVAVVFAALFVVVLLAMCVASRNSGYRQGQIDAANGIMQYARVETPDGIRWYDLDNPSTLYDDREHGDE